MNWTRHCPTESGKHIENGLEVEHVGLKSMPRDREIAHEIARRERRAKRRKRAKLLEDVPQPLPSGRRVQNLL